MQRTFGVIAGGLASSLTSVRLLESHLYEAPSGDAVFFRIAIGLILVGTLAACWVPAYRATTVSVMDALRTE